MKRFCIAVVLSFALTVPVSAGWMATGVVAEPAGQMETPTAGGWMETGIVNPPAGVMSTGEGVLEIAVTLLQGVLSVF